MRKKNYIFNRVAIIGMGLIGSSLSYAIKRKKISRYVSATAASNKTIRVIKKLKLAEEFQHYVVLSSPTRFIRDWVVSRYVDKILEIIILALFEIQKLHLNWINMQALI